METHVVQKDYFVLFTSEQFPYVMLCSNLMMVSHLDEDEVSVNEAVRKSETSYTKGTTPSSKVTKLCKKQCQILRSLRLKEK